MMIIEHVEIYGLAESIKASGFPKGNDDINYSRVERLGSCSTGTGHDCFLKGITVQADITAPQYFWLQFGRYHFADIVSSESKMHTILEMDLDEKCNEYVNAGIIGILKNMIEEHKADPCSYGFQRIVASCPMGLMLKARITTNYLQLKTILQQRKNHKLVEWRMFCQWVEELPEFKVLTQRGTSIES